VDEWRRAIAFVRALDERCAEEVVPFRWGRALINRTLASVPDLNYLLADRSLEGVTAEVLAAQADRIQGGTGISFRRMNVDDQEAAERLLPGFTALDFTPERFCVMAHHQAPDREVDITGVRQVDWATYRPARKREIESWAPTALIAEQALRKQALTATLLDTTYLAALVDGAPASFCELRRVGPVAQIEFVETLEPFRRRGLARQVVSAALRAAEGAAFIFLVADLFDWPQHFYERLGFETVGIESRFMRHADGYPGSSVDPVPSA
jgi:ribosomal protein S18 acetylase RimI-like enzyme